MASGSTTSLGGARIGIEVMDVKAPIAPLLIVFGVLVLVSVVMDYAMW